MPRYAVSVFDLTHDGDNHFWRSMHFHILVLGVTDHKPWGLMLIAGISVTLKSEKHGC